MAVTAVTIDFWNTLYDSSNGPARNAERMDALRQAIKLEGGHQPDEEQIVKAYRGVWEYFDEQWLERQRTPTSGEMADYILRKLDVPLNPVLMLGVVDTFDSGILRHPPALLPGVVSALEYLSERARLAIISDTAFSGGDTLHRLMLDTGIAQYFTAFIFSDQTGVAKPHARAFTTALELLGGRAAQAVHVGDIERTDITGARNAGMKAVLYRGDPAGHKYVEKHTQADAIMDSWHDVQSVFAPFIDAVS